ncbi:MAG TPA: DUF881 domain-containing protein [Actinomycetota bacterium]|nr:DUF881 domain-containing protein [Actinomycetota bacterium]
MKIEPETTEHRERPRPRVPAVPRPGQIALALAVALLGFLLATQFRASEDLQGRLAGEREEDLALLLANLQQRSDALIEETVALRIELARAASSQDQERVLAENAARQLADLRMLLGLVKARGPGIEIVVADPEATVAADTLVDTVQELRDAGAEAIEINGVRVVAETSFSGSPGSIRVNRATSLRAPYQIRAIGHPQTMAEAMRIPGGVVDAVTARPAATIDITEHESMVIASLHPAPRFSYATPT